jgi:predicted N-acyltransferase
MEPEKIKSMQDILCAIRDHETATDYWVRLKEGATNAFNNKEFKVNTISIAIRYLHGNGTWNNSSNNASLMTEGMTTYFNENFHEIMNYIDNYVMLKRKKLNKELKKAMIEGLGLKTD